jgi:dienelactone hydrolase
MTHRMLRFAAGLALAAAPLPAPHGKFTVGTAVVYATDTARRDSTLPEGRPITLQLWYPALKEKSLAPYLVESGLSAALVRTGYYGADSATIREWSRARTHSYENADPKEGSFPLIAFSVGLGVIRANYTTIAEALASDGYIVALVESPLQGFMALPSGEIVSDTIGITGEPAGHRAGVRQWTRDISYALDILQKRTIAGVPMKVASEIDWARIGAVGHSSGGLVAFATCESDKRVRTCVDMDGGFASPDRQPLADFVAAGMTKPSLLLRSQPLYDDTTFKRRGITRAEWEKGAEGGRAALNDFLDRSPCRPSVASVAGTGHFSFTDAPFLLPDAINRFGGRIIRPARGLEVITATLRGFFDDQFRGSHAAFAGLPRKYPELSLVVSKVACRTIR